VVEQLGQRGRQVVEKAYDLRVVGAQLLGVYHRLIPQTRNKGVAA